MKSVKKKYAALIAGAAISALALTGCAGPSGASNASDASNAKSGAGQTLNVYVGAQSQYATQQQQWFQDISTAFEKQTGAKVNFQLRNSSSELLTKIQTSMVANQGPDIFDVGTTFTPTAYSTGGFVPLTAENWSKVGGKEKFIPASTGMSGPDADNQIGVPWTSIPLTLAYNTEMLAKAGISEPPTTWDELAAQAKKMTGNGNYGIATGYKDGYLPWKFIWAMNRQAGNPTVDGKKARVDDPITLKAIQTYFGWLTKEHIVDPASVGWTSDQAMAAFADGKAAFLPFAASNTIPTLDKSALQGKYKFVQMPTVPPGATSTPSGGLPVSTILGGENLIVAKYSKNQDLAFQLIKFLTDDEQQKIQYSTFGALPVNQSTAAELEKSKPALAAFVKAEESSGATPFTGAWGDIQIALTNVVVQSIPGLASGSVDDSSLKSLLADAQQKAQSALDRAK